MVAAVVADIVTDFVVSFAAPDAVTMPETDDSEGTRGMEVSVARVVITPELVTIELVGVAPAERPRYRFSVSALCYDCAACRRSMNKARRSQLIKSLG